LVYAFENINKLSKIYLDDKDVSHDTFYIDTLKGIIKKYKRDKMGHYYFYEDALAFETLTGNIKIIFKDGTEEVTKKAKKIK